MNIFIQIIGVCAVVGFLIWAFNTLVTVIDPKFKMIIVGVACLAVFLWILGFFGFHLFPR